MASPLVSEIVPEKCEFGKFIICDTKTPIFPMSVHYELRPV